MTDSARVVSGSVESIAAISEENSASAEEVVASATSLASMADELDAIVARFRIDESAVSGLAEPVQMPSRAGRSRRAA
jgi:hypothetical protein